MTYTTEKEIAIEAVSQAAKLCEQVRAEMVNLDAIEKGDKSPVTVADFGAQALVCHHLLTHFGDDDIVGEEDSASLQQPENATQLAQVSQYVQTFYPQASTATICEWIDAGNGGVNKRFWTLDPIDGTKGFLRNDQYAIALALIEDNQVKVSALACPALPVSLNNPTGAKGVIFVAVRGEGAMMAPLYTTNFQSIAVTRQTNLRFVESVEAGHGNHDLQQEIARLAGIVKPSLRMDSQAKYGAVARGDAALYLRLPSSKYANYREKIWDHAAGSLIVEEAGGQVSDMFGKPLNFYSDYKMHDNRGVIVSNGFIHNAAIDALANN